MQTLWDFQEACRERKREALRNHRSALVVSPCGSGKGSMIADDCRGAVERGKSVRVSVHRRVLVKQLAERLALNGVPYTVEMANLPDEPWAVQDPSAPVVVSSRDTALSRGSLPPCDLHIIDECHLFETNGYQRIQDAVSPRWTVGYTATPIQSDGKGLSNRVFETMVEAAKIEELIAKKKIVPVEVFAPVGALKRRRKGLKIEVSGDPVKQWEKNANGLRTATFCATVSESKAVRDAFLAEGIAAAHIDQKTPEDERDRVFAAITAGEILVLCNVYVGEVGLDLPALECVQLLTKCFSPIAFWQRIGRAMRAYDAGGKTRAVLLDHGGAVGQHGWPNLSPEWSLDDREYVQKRQEERFGEDAPADARPVVCQNCGRGSVGCAVCPSCGRPLFREHRENPELGREGLSLIADAAEFATGAKNYQREWANLLFQAGASGKPFTWAASVFNTRFKVWPEAAGVSPLPTYEQRRQKVGDVFPQYDRRRVVQ